MASIVDLSEDPPRLNGGACRDCGFVFFPHQTHGCERCGAHGAALRPHPLDGRGTVTATTVVHRHADPRRPAPFRVVQLTLDGGPSVRAVAVDGAAPEVGERVRLVTDDGIDEVRVAPA